MDDLEELKIKAEIDGIMEGVKTIMQKIDAIMPEAEQEQIEDAGENYNSSDNNETGVT